MSKEYCSLKRIVKNKMFEEYTFLLINCLPMRYLVKVQNSNEHSSRSIEADRQVSPPLRCAASN